MILEIELFNKFDYSTFMKNIILILFIFFHSALLGQSNWTLYPKKDSIVEKDSVAIAKADSLMPDSSITEEIPLKQKRTLFNTSLLKVILLSMLTTELTV